MSLISNPEDKITHIRIEGFKVKENKETTIAEYLTPKPPEKPKSKTGAETTSS